MDIPKIVIGLGYGDEGKGRTVDYLCSLNPDAVVVRFSGGQQCGHTVMTDKIKHTFSNFGSGTLRGCPTYYSEHTTIYPTTLYKELGMLIKKGISPEIVIHPLAKLTTPFDVLANRDCEANKKHGTCGLGIGKTMKRHNESPFKLFAMDLLNPDILREKLESINRHYYPEIDYVENLDYINLYINAVLKINWKIDTYEYLIDKSLIFEGSQGVLLDMDHGVFPHVTYSNTTSKNAIEICKKLGIDAVDVYGVTRSYLTRHGNGPFEVADLGGLENTEEEINVTNQFQGEFKVGAMDYPQLMHALYTDNIYSGPFSNSYTLVVTCLDQYPKFDFGYFKEWNHLKFDSPKNVTL